MIKVEPKFDGSNTVSLSCSTKDELEFLKEGGGKKALDKFVEQNFKKKGNLSIKTWADYLAFMKALPKDVLEMFYGRHFYYSDIGELEIQDAFIIKNELSKGMAFNSETLKSLEKLLNHIYSIGLS